MLYDRNISRTRTYACEVCATVKPWRFNSVNRFCSRSCNPQTQKGKFVSDEARLKMSLGSKGKRKNPTTEFKPGERVSRTTEFKPGQPSWSAGKQRLDMRGELHPNWKGGESYRRHAIESAPYKDWRKAVFTRDNYTCQMCHQRGGLLNADHIKSWALHPHLRFEVSNGRTLCVDCHRKTPTWGANKKKLMILEGARG